MLRHKADLAGYVALILLAASVAACGQQDPASEDLYQAVDALYDAAVAETDRFQVVAEIDHSRLAAAEGEVMPPARVVIFSDSAVNTPILQQNPRAGLDLPFRILAFTENDVPVITHTTSEFLKRRHGLPDSRALAAYDESLLETIRALPADALAPIDASSVGEGQGIATLDSGYGFDETIDRLRNAILAEGGTAWFGEIDYHEEAALRGTELPRLTLLLWGAPAPGAKAMRDFPRMGLDAFCQKTLVYQPPGDSVKVLYNEMTAFAEMHYGEIALPHRVITRRMMKTLGSAVEPAAD